MKHLPVSLHFTILWIFLATSSWGEELSPSAKSAIELHILDRAKHSAARGVVEGLRKDYQESLGDKGRLLVVYPSTDDAISWVLWIYLRTEGCQVGRFFPFETQQKSWRALFFDHPDDEHASAFLPVSSVLMDNVQRLGRQDNGRSHESEYDMHLNFIHGVEGKLHEQRIELQDRDPQTLVQQLLGEGSVGTKILPAKDKAALLRNDR